jgi:hypothetical protein
MALYHFSAKIVCRSRGQSAVASAAYRARTRLLDERLGKTFDYSRRRGLVRTEIMAPDNAPDWMRDREELWNAVEKVERRKDSQLARSLDIALPHELSLDHNTELLRGFIQEQFVDKGMIADIAIHAPGGEGDTRNIHAHILLTTREIAGPGFGLKARQWDRKEELEQWREAWADHANRVLERERFEERIDHRSLVDQGVDREPTTHIGPAGKQMEQRGKPSDRARQYRNIEAANDDLALAKKELRASEKRLVELKRQLAAERMEKIQKIVRAVKGTREKPEQTQAPTTERSAEPGSAPPLKQPEAKPRRQRPRAAARMEQTEKTVRAADAFWQKPEGRVPTTPERPREPEPPAPPKQPEPSAAEAERPPEAAPPAPAQQPEVPSTTPREPPPSKYAKLIEAQNYAARAKDEEKQKAGREQQKEKDKDKDKDRDEDNEKDERERKPDRER